MSDLIRVGAHDSRCVEIDAPSGVRYKATNGGMYSMLPSDAKALLAEGGFKTGIGPGANSPGGHTCPRGHRNYLPTCGRCKDLESREALVQAGFGPLDPRADGEPLTIYAPDDMDEQGRKIYPDPENVEW